jgi:predicted DNA-binding protein YlxM (UPF0122 family)
MASISQTNLKKIEKLYYQEGLSMREIADELGVKLDAVCYFMRKNGLKRRSRNETNKILFEKKNPSFKLRNNLSQNLEKLRVVCTALYWAEGAKRSRIVDFANSEVEMCKLFMRFLRKVCGVDERRLRVYLYCHYNQNPHELISFWSRELLIPPKQFTKPYIRHVPKKGTNKRDQRMKMGLVHIRYGDLKLVNQIKKWINELKK